MLIIEIPLILSSFFADFIAFKTSIKPILVFPAINALAFSGVTFNVLSKYLTFKSDFEENYPEIITLFEESQQLELIELQIKLNYIFHKVF